MHTGPRRRCSNTCAYAIQCVQFRDVLAARAASQRPITSKSSTTPTRCAAGRLHCRTCTFCVNGITGSRRIDASTPNASIPNTSKTHRLSHPHSRTDRVPLTRPENPRTLQHLHDVRNQTQLRTPPRAGGSDPTCSSWSMTAVIWRPQRRSQPSPQRGQRIGSWSKPVKRHNAMLKRGMRDSRSCCASRNGADVRASAPAYCRTRLSKTSIKHAPCMTPRAEDETARMHRPSDVGRADSGTSHSAPTPHTYSTPNIETAEQGH